MWDVCTSHADYISCDVTSSDVNHVTSLHIGVVSPTSDEIGDVASTLLGLIPWKVFIVATVLARKFYKNLQNFRWKDAWLYVYVFCLKKMLSGTETMARRVSSGWWTKLTGRWNEGTTWRNGSTPTRLMERRDDGMKRSMGQDCGGCTRRPQRWGIGVIGVVIQKECFGWILSNC